MPAEILDGRAAAADVRTSLRARVAALSERGLRPGLGTVLVGNDPGSTAYVAGKHRDCAEVGIASLRVDLPAAATQAQVLDAIAGLNADPTCHGFIVRSRPAWTRTRRWRASPRPRTPTASRR